MSTKTSTAALESLSQRLLLLQRRIPRHPASGFFGRWRRRGDFERAASLHPPRRSKMCARNRARMSSGRAEEGNCVWSLEFKEVDQN